MVAVYIGIIIQIVEDGPLSLSALGFFFTFGSFIIAAFFHPQEWTNVFYLVIYLAMIPSVYLLMTIYAIFNMDDVSWGTRETDVGKKAKLESEDKNEEPEKKTGLIAAIQSLLFKNKDAISFFKRTQENWQQQQQVENSAHILERLKNIERTMNSIQESKIPNDKEARPKKNVNGKERWKQIAWNLIKRKKHLKDLDLQNLKNLDYWFQNESNENRCKILTKATVKEIEHDEKKFWNNLLEEYLFPIIKDEKTMKKDKENLTKLKNSFALGFILLNTMWVTAIYMLQSNVDVLGLKWPFGAKGPTIEFDTSDIERNTLIIVRYEYSTLEPIGFVFVAAFICVIIFQCIGMLLHVTETLEQIISHVTIFPATGKDIEDKKLKAKPVPSPLSVFEKLRKYEQEKSDAESTNNFEGISNKVNKRSNEKRGHCTSSTDDIRTMPDKKTEMTMREKVQLVLDTMEKQEGQIQEDGSIEQKKENFRKLSY